MGPSTSDTTGSDAGALSALLAPVEIAGLTLHLARPGAPVGRLAALGTGLSPYWAFAWPGGRALAAFVIEQPEQVRGKRVIDFGCGCGIAGLAAARAGAAQVVACDIDPLARELTALNAACNRLDVTVANGVAAELEADVILAGDVFYVPDVARTSLQLLKERVARGAVVLIGDPGRKDLPPGLTMLATYPSKEVGSSSAATASVFGLA